MAQNYGSTDIIEDTTNVLNLVVRIGNNVQNIRQITHDLNDLYAIMGGPHDTPQKKLRILQQQQKAKDLLIITRQLFETISSIKFSDGGARLALSKVKDDYDSIVPKLNEIQQMIAVKWSQMASEARKAVSISSLDREESVENLTVQLVKREELEVEDAFERVKQIEEALYKVEKLQADISQIVMENQEQVRKIEINVINAEEDVDMGNEQLTTAILHKKSAFKKKMCIAAIVIIILLIIALIIYFSVRNK